MTRKIWVVLDDKTYRMLVRLARPRGTNRSLVVRDAVRHFADRERADRRLGAVLAQQRARQAMESGIAAFNARRLLPHKHVVRRIGRGS